MWSLYNAVHWNIRTFLWVPFWLIRHHCHWCAVFPNCIILDHVIIGLFFYILCTMWNLYDALICWIYKLKSHHIEIITNFSITHKICSWSCYTLFPMLWLYNGPSACEVTLKGMSKIDCHQTTTNCKCCAAYFFGCAEYCIWCWCWLPFCC